MVSAWEGDRNVNSVKLGAKKERGRILDFVAAFGSIIERLRVVCDIGPSLRDKIALINLSSK